MDFMGTISCIVKRESESEAGQMESQNSSINDCSALSRCKIDYDSAVSASSPFATGVSGLASTQKLTPRK